MAEQPVTLTPRMMRTLTHANQLAQARGHDYVGTEHVILALLEDPAGIAGLVIHRLGYAAPIREEVIRIMESVGYASKARPPSGWHSHAKRPAPRPAPSR